ncbi:hypothetical protein [Undibacterium sp.]|jgi:hypothetical protein|uniref:hypothetical protein n=1 Tax=Undibacterium sp. TaxID=1914977 RepID=UPI002B9378C7|nr:hypothetical protein [Undibacterium sp.]HTD06117.1 hypothetical protein [Undibacterium sp.]
MNEKSELSDLAGALLRGLQEAPKKNKDYARIAEYAGTIFGMSVQPISQELFHENANNIMIFFKGFVKFCGLAVGLSEDECNYAFEIFFVEITGLPHQDGAMTFSVLDRMAKTPEGTALIKAGQLAAYDCQEGNTAGAIAALGKALGI